SLERRSVPLRKRNAVGLDRAGRGLRLDETFWLSRKSGRDAQRHPWLRSCNSALGIQRQCAPLLGLHFRGQASPARAPVAPLWLELERHPASRGISRASWRLLSFARRLRWRDG